MSGAAEPVVRPARSGDAGEIGRVYVDTWRAAYAGMVPDHVLIGMTEARQEAQWARVVGGDRRREFILVADDPRDGVVGFGSAGPARGQLPFGGEVYTLYVDQDHQGRGLGRQLLRGLFHGLVERRLPSAVIWVLAANPSRFFYEVMGGKRVAEQKERLWGTNLPEFAYGWPDLKQALATSLGAPDRR